MATKHIVLLSTLALLASCGSNTPQPSGPQASNVAWKDMNREQRFAHMKTVVLPKMRDSFKAFDEKRFAKVTCATCHGENAKERDFKMPNPALPKLSTEGGFKKHREKDAEITKFMMEKVTPDMASLLGMPRYDPKTHQGFGCFGCHTNEAPAPPAAP